MTINLTEENLIETREDSESTRYSKEDLHRIEATCKDDNPEQELQEITTPLQMAFVGVYKEVTQLNTELKKNEMDVLGVTKIEHLLEETPYTRQDEILRLETIAQNLKRVTQIKQTISEEHASLARESTAIFKPIGDAKKEVGGAYKHNISENSPEEGDPKTQSENLANYTSLVSEQALNLITIVRRGTVRGGNTVETITSIAQAAVIGKNELANALELIEQQETVYKNQGNEIAELEIRQVKLELERMEEIIRPKAKEIEDGEINFVAKGSTTTDKLIGMQSKYEARFGQALQIREQL